MSEHPTMNIETIRAEARKMLKSTSDDPTFHTAVMMFAALHVGQGFQELADYTDLPEEFIRERAARLLASNIWLGDDTFDIKWFDDDGGIAFLLYLSVAEGRLVRLPGHRYQMTDSGKSYVENNLLRPGEP